MSLLYDAAIAWNKLRDTHYYLLLGRKKKWSFSFVLDFSPDEFPHLAGVQYATDIDFGINKAELRGSRFISKIINGDIDSEVIEKSINWEGKIKGRLQSIIELENTLDSDFLICDFDSRKVPHGSNIEAKFVIKNKHSESIFFVLVDGDNDRWFCRSVFQFRVADYTANQARLTVLKKQKCKGEEVITVYIHPNYNPDEETQEN